jgi:hypothetical protein
MREKVLDQSELICEFENPDTLEPPIEWPKELKPLIMQKYVNQTSSQQEDLAKESLFSRPILFK